MGDIFEDWKTTVIDSAIEMTPSFMQRYSIHCAHQDVVHYFEPIHDTFERQDKLDPHVISKISVESHKEIETWNLQ